MRVIKIDGCNVCPYVRTIMTEPNLNLKYCGCLDSDDEEYLVDISDHIVFKTIPEWCCLDN